MRSKELRGPKRASRHSASRALTSRSMAGICSRMKTAASSDVVVEESKRRQPRRLYSSRALSKELGVSPTTVNKWFHGGVLKPFALQAHDDSPIFDLPGVRKQIDSRTHKGAILRAGIERSRIYEANRKDRKK